MEKGFFHTHRREIFGFGIGVLAAVLVIIFPQLHRDLDWIDQLGYPGMLLAGMMYGSGLTASLATILFLDTPASLHPFAVAIIGGFGSAMYDSLIFFITRRQARHGWLATRIHRLRARHHIPHWPVLLLGSAILISPLPDELAAGLLGMSEGKARNFFFYSFISNTFGILMIQRLGQSS